MCLLMPSTHPPDSELSSNRSWHLNSISILRHPGFPETIHSKEGKIFFYWLIPLHPFMSGQRPSTSSAVLATLGVWPCSAGKPRSWWRWEGGLSCRPSVTRHVPEDGANLGLLNDLQSGQQPPALCPQLHSQNSRGPKPCPFPFMDQQAPW